MSQPTSVLDAVREVYFWQYSRTDCFNQLLLDLFQKADPSNRKRLDMAFPLLFEAWSQWSEAGDNGNDLFRKYGIIKDNEDEETK